MGSKVIALLRVSSEAQAGPDRAGLPRQRDEIARIVARERLSVVETVELAGVSGAEVRQDPRFQRVLARLREPEIDGVIVAAFDRLIRPARFADFAVLDDFADAGAMLYTAGTTWDLRTEAHQLLALVFGHQAKSERSQIAARTAAGRQRRRDAGHKAEAPTVGMPRGVAYDRARGEAGEWYYVEPEASRVLEAYRMVLGGITNLAEIARRCGWGRGHAAHASWSARSVLGQSLYAGLYHGVPAPGLNPPLIRVADWEAVQSILRTARPRRAPRVPRDEIGAVYAGHLACHVCGAALWALPPRRDQAGYARYLCANARERGCPMGSVSARLADPVIDRELEARLGSIETLLRLIADASAEGERRAAAPAAGLERQRTILDNRRTARLRQHEMGAISDRELRKALAVLDAEVEAIRAAQDRAGEEIVVGDEVVEAVVRAFSRWRDLDPSVRRSLLRDLGVTVRVSRPGPRAVTVEAVDVGAFGSRDSVRLYK